MAQFEERLLPIPKEPGSNPVIGNFYWTFIYCQLFEEKDENKEKEAGNGPFKKKIYINLCFDSFKRD